MKATFNLLHKIAEAGTLLSLTGMISAVVIQVFARFFLPSAPSWTEEIARMFFIYMVTFGAGLGIRSNEYVRLSIIQNWISDRLYHTLFLSVQLLIAVFFGVLFFVSFDFFWLGTHERSPGLLLPMQIVFASMPILMFSISIFSVEKIIQFAKPPEQ